MLRILIATALGLPPSVARSLRMRNCRPAVLEPGRTPLLLALNAGDPSFEADPTDALNEPAPPRANAGQRSATGSRGGPVRGVPGTL